MPCKNWVAVPSFSWSEEACELQQGATAVPSTSAVFTTLLTTVSDIPIFLAVWQWLSHSWANAITTLFFIVKLTRTHYNVRSTKCEWWNEKVVARGKQAREHWRCISHCAWQLPWVIDNLPLFDTFHGGKLSIAASLMDTLFFLQSNPSHHFQEFCDMSQHH